MDWKINMCLSKIRTLTIEDIDEMSSEDVHSIIQDLLKRLDVQNPTRVLKVADRESLIPEN